MSKNDITGDNMISKCNSKSYEDNYDLIGGNTRLAGLIKNDINPKLWVVDAPKENIEEMKNNIYMSGMNDIIVKPYDITKFISCIIKNISKKNLRLF